MSGRASSHAISRGFCRVLLMSGYTGSELTDGEVGAGTAFLPKPFTPHALLTKVRAVIDGA